MQKEDKILVVDISTVMAGSQKVTMNVVKGFKDKGLKIKSLIRNQDNRVNDIYKENNPSFFILDKCLGKYFGTGNFNLSSLNVFSKINLVLLIVIWNIQVIYCALKNRTKIIYCYDPKGIIVCGLFSKLLGFKIIWHLHGELKFPKKINKFLCKMATEIIVPSNYIKSEIASLSDSTTIYNGFDFSSCRDVIKKKNNVCELIYVGTIVPQKGLHSLILSLTNSSPKVNDNKIYNLTVLGEPVGELGRVYYDYLKSLVKELPKNVTVNFLGWVNEPLTNIENSDVLVFPSIQEGEVCISGEIIKFSSSEALPTVLIEALAFSVPVIATGISGVTEIIPDDGSSVVIDRFDTENIYELIEKVCFKNRVNKEHIRDKFGREKMNKRIFDIIKDYI